jgi:uncharacterized membrane protein
VLSYICDLILLRSSFEHLSLFSFYLSLGGLAMGVFALISGLIDQFSLSGKKAVRRGRIHGILNVLWMLVFAAFAIGKVANYPFIGQPDRIEYIVKGIVIAGIIYSDFLGAELVYGNREK